MRTCSLRRGILLCLAMLLAGINLTCRDKTPQPTDENKLEADVNVPAETDADAPAQPAGEKVAVTVNGVQITEDDVLKIIGPQIERIDQQGEKLPPAVAEQYKKQLREQALEQLIRRQLLDDKIEDANIVVTEEEVMNQLKRFASEQNMSLEEFKKTMERYNRTFEEVKQDVRKVTEEEAKQYYDENPKRFNMPERIRVSHILVQYHLTDPNVDPNEAKAKAKAKAQNLLQQIKDGADFAELAKANSDCPSAPKGGDLGYIAKGDTTPQFEKAAFGLKVGQISDVVETEYGCHIIKVTDHQDARIIPFEQAKDGIIEQLTEKKQLDFAEKYINSLKTQAKIIFPPAQPPSS
jgi:peptidyl-prolyl cis-trans isomerase C